MSIKRELENRYKAASILSSKRGEVERIADKIESNRERYQQIQERIVFKYQTPATATVVCETKEGPQRAKEWIEWDDGSPPTILSEISTDPRARVVLDSLMENSNSDD